MKVRVENAQQAVVELLVGLQVTDEGRHHLKAVINAQERIIVEFILLLTEETLNTLHQLVHQLTANRNDLVLKVSGNLIQGIDNLLDTKLVHDVDEDLENGLDVRTNQLENEIEGSRNTSLQASVEI